MSARSLFHHGIAVVGGLALSTTLIASAHAVEEFYSQNSLNIVIGYPPGGAYDLHARTVGRHINNHLPGNPTVVPRNMPGAGSLTAANYLYNNAPQDGSHIGSFSRGLVTEPLLGGEGVRFDAQKLSWIGTPTPEISVIFTWHESPIQQTGDLFERETIVAATGSGADSAVFPVLMNALIGTRFRVVTGYDGQPGTMLAIERGEVHGSAGTSWSGLKSVKPDWIEDKRINILLQFANEPHPVDLQDVPLVVDFVKTQEDRQVLDLILSRQVWAYPLVAPPGVPSDRVAALRKAFDATMQDPGYLADINKQGFEIQPIGGERIQQLIDDLYRTPKEVQERARRIIAEQRGVTTKSAN